MATRKSPAKTQDGAAQDAAAQADGAQAAAASAEAEQIAAMGYEAAKGELVEIVSKLEGGQVGIEEAMTLWRRADALAQHCENWLDQAAASLAPADES